MNYKNLINFSHIFPNWNRFFTHLPTQMWEEFQKLFSRNWGMWMNLNFRTSCWCGGGGGWERVILFHWILKLNGPNLFQRCSTLPWDDETITSGHYWCKQLYHLLNFSETLPMYTLEGMHWLSWILSQNVFKT